MVDVDAVCGGGGSGGDDCIVVARYANWKDQRVIEGLSDVFKINREETTRSKEKCEEISVVVARLI